MIISYGRYALKYPKTEQCYRLRLRFAYLRA